MNRKLISILLKLVVIFAFAGFILVGIGPVRWFAASIIRTEPQLADKELFAVLYVNAGFIPVYISLVLAWLVFDAIGSDRGFSYVNAKRLDIAAIMAIVDIVMVIIANMIFNSWNIGGPPTIMCTMGLTFLGLAAAIVCFSLARLVSEAARLKQEVDLTI
ncbi:MAG: DUF2975 domain-containing protein [Clostridiales bacterium]|nr:DUF2975 domain-containing protein [Clostridiales bacterium]